MMELVNEVKLHLDATLMPKPAGYNVGFNAGEAAGQTVMHVHIHVIPRFTGDMDDPRGGVRHVIPGKGNYLVTDKSENLQKQVDGQSDSCGGKVNRQLDGQSDVHAEVKGETSLALSTGHPNSGLWGQISDRLLGAKQVDILASFVQCSGLDVVEQRLLQAIREQSMVRIMVGDYLLISDPVALKRLYNWQEVVSDHDEYLGKLNVRLVEISKLPTNPKSFHPKSWRIIDNQQSFIAVGSSNLSRPALETGIEWNLLSTTSLQMDTHDDFAKEYDALWILATPLTKDVVEEYAKRAKEYRKLHFEPERIDDRFVPEPRPWQKIALESLQRIRDAGYNKALVAVATGMGKTWLAAFDARQVGEKLGRRPRVLVIAHRSHILVQAESAISCVLDESSVAGTTSWYIGARDDLSGDLVIASVQKLSRPEGLIRLSMESFDYAIIDEVHHAHAPTYRRVLAQLNASFVLGLTATPERGDGIDVASIFDDNLAHQATIGDGIAEESLVPFHYVGIRDTVDFEQIPWRNGKFEVSELERKVEQSERMQRLWKAMQDHPSDRTIVFCCSRRHALFARDWLRSQGISSAAVFSGEGSDGQIESLNGLRTGRLKALCVVDMFNEGLDIPAVDRVIMLRPTESKVIFLQQLGRGLRASEGKTRLLVIDFVGNHRMFAQRMLNILSLGGTDVSWNDLKKWIEGKKPQLPAGCLLDVEIEARDLIAQFIPRGSQAGLETYRALRDELGRRPDASELFAHGILPRTVSQGAGSWFQFVATEGDLNEQESEVLKSFKDWLITVETTSLNKSYKMVVLRVLLFQGNLFKPVGLNEFSKKCRNYMLQHPVLRRDLMEGDHSVDHQTAADEEWAAWWRKWPIDRWLDEQNGKRWFELAGDALRLAVDCQADLKGAFESMTEELVDWRLAAYSKSHRLTDRTESDLSFEARVSHAGGRAMLFLPDQKTLPERPVGLVNVRLPNNSEWEFKFVKIACNVAKPIGSGETNELISLLRSWFGENAGLPGTDFKVLFELKGENWSIRPLDVMPQSLASDEQPMEVVTLRPVIEESISKEAEYRTHVPVYDLVASAGGWGEDGVPEAIGWMMVNSSGLSRGMFVAKVVGQSMEPTIQSGSWCLFRPCPSGSRQNRLLLVQVNTHTDPVDGGRYTVKKYRSVKKVSEDGLEHQAIELVPINPDFGPITVNSETAADLRIVGEFVEVV